MYRFSIIDEHFVIDSITNIRYVLDKKQYEEMCELKDSFNQDVYLSKLLITGSLIQYNATFWNNRL